MEGIAAECSTRVYSKCSGTPAHTASGVPGDGLRGSCALSPRLRQHLDPVETVLGASAGGKGEAHLLKAGVHDVFAVAGTVEPALDDLIDRLRSVGDVLP